MGFGHCNLPKFDSRHPRRSKQKGGYLRSTDVREPGLVGQPIVSITARIYLVGRTLPGKLVAGFLRVYFVRLNPVRHALNHTLFRRK